MTERFTCPLEDETYEVYEGYRRCPWFHQKVAIITKREGEEPRHILSTGKWKQPVPDERMGLVA